MRLREADEGALWRREASELRGFIVAAVSVDPGGALAEEDQWHPVYDEVGVCCQAAVHEPLVEQLLHLRVGLIRGYHIPHAALPEVRYHCMYKVLLDSIRRTEELYVQLRSDVIFVHTLCDGGHIGLVQLRERVRPRLRAACVGLLAIKVSTIEDDEWYCSIAM